MWVPPYFLKFPFPAEWEERASTNSLSKAAGAGVGADGSLRNLALDGPCLSIPLIL